MRSPDYIYTWSYYSEKQKAVNTVIKRYKLPMSFGISEYVNTSNDSIIDYLMNRLNYAQSEECGEAANSGVYNAQKAIELLNTLKGIL